MRRPIVSDSLNVPPILSGNKIRLRPKRLVDAIEDYQWRTDSELCQLDATQPITNSFEEYLRLTAIVPLYSSKSCNFAIETLDDKHIGNCSYFSIDEDKGDAEIGIMIGDKAYWGCGYGIDAMSTALNYAFSQANLKRIYLKTLDWNIRAQKCFKKCGFIPYGSLVSGEYRFILMEIRRSEKNRCWWRK